jgi:hypothetical protein
MKPGMFVLSLVMVAAVALSAGSARAQTLTLGTDGACFTINGQRQFLLGASYYGGLGAPDDFVRRDLDDLKRLGFNWIRVWATWESFGNDVSAVNRDGTAREPYLSKLKWLVRQAQRRGMVVDVTLSRGSLLSNQATHLRAVETLASALKTFRGVYFDLANEHGVGDARFVSFAELRQLRDAVKKIDPERLVTASSGDMDQEELRHHLIEAGLDFVAPHRPREAGSPAQTAAKTEQLIADMKALGRVAPVMYQEPFRRDYGDWQPGLEDFLTDLRGAKQGGAAGWCFHNGSSRRNEGRPGRSFGMSQSQGRLMDQLDPVEKEFVQQAAACLR